ncbi:MAG: putative dsRNA-binding protein [Bacteroidaceae bacterium]|nr:putative dsRNA-binding protein [Bacteroidaceae bacterium]
MHKSVAYHEREVHRGKGEKAAASRESYLNNERLEFLGDAVLGAIVADILYKHYGRKQEGFLTNLRSKIVCRKSLNNLAVNIGLDKLIQHTGAVTTGHNSFMNGNAFEAFFGAIYLDRGYDYCYRFLEDKVFKHYINIDKVAELEENFKSALIEWCQKYQYKFEFIHKEMRDANNSKVPMFHSQILIEGIPCGVGDGYSKKESDQNAASQVLKKIRKGKEIVLVLKNAKNKNVSLQNEAEGSKS